MDNLKTVYNRNDLLEGAILKIHHNDNFEGWGKLISQRPNSTMTFIDTNAVYVNECWLVEFVDVQQVPAEMATNERFNQISLSGFRTHRYFTYFGEHNWERYIQRFGIPDEYKVPPSEGNRLNDKNDLF